MTWTSNPTVAAKNAEILRSEMEVQSLVQRLIMHAVTDLSIQASYSPLQCEEMVAASGEMAGPKGTCFTSGNTVTSICNMLQPRVRRQPQQQPVECNVMQRSTVPVQHRTISGTLSTTNIIMAYWSTQMWQDMMNRVARSLASGSFRIAVLWSFCHSWKLIDEI
ncbi:hypothetical protein KIN20_030968 [Parelaphostrongylus tenuis]|uniref:Uncharacterized protein n=1 Tax=Parelaphostrongylus tenuis TaxID=148309 RepID=A0AAD5R4F9_PARTN|nr:hypothetical protein KIN20_030968 [Parelaphostrongylus tenuis]